MTHVMIDLETLGTAADCVILTVGAIKFSPKTFEQVGSQFYRRLDLQPQLNKHRTACASTLNWWMNQSEAVRNEAFTKEPRSLLVTALIDLQAWMPEDIKGVWGNGADFDNAILQHAWNSHFTSELNSQLWPYWANRCFRTFTNVFDPQKNLRPKKNDHHALSDCWNQIRWMARISLEMDVEIR